jgi:hypothetical protein
VTVADRVCVYLPGYKVSDDLSGELVEELHRVR